MQALGGLLITTESALRDFQQNNKPHFINLKWGLLIYIKLNMIIYLRSEADKMQ